MAPKSSAKGKAAVDNAAGKNVGDWIPCTLKEADMKALEKEGLVAPKAESFWHVIAEEDHPQPLRGEVVMMKTHIERGFSLPPSDFMSEVLEHYKLNPQLLSPNSILILCGYQSLSEGYLGVHPTLELFMYYYMIKRMPVEGNTMRTCGSVCFKIRNDRRYPEVPSHESVKNWTGTFFYCTDKAAPGKSFGLPAFEVGPGKAVESWDGPEDVTL